MQHNIVVGCFALSKNGLYLSCHECLCNSSFCHWLLFPELHQHETLTTDVKINVHHYHQCSHSSVGTCIRIHKIRLIRVHPEQFFLKMQSSPMGFSKLQFLPLGLWSRQKDTDHLLQRKLSCENTQVVLGRIHMVRGGPCLWTASVGAGHLWTASVGAGHLKGHQQQFWMTAPLSNLRAAIWWESLKQNQPGKQSPNSWLTEMVWDNHTVHTLSCWIWGELATQKYRNSACSENTLISRAKRSISSRQSCF